MPRLEFFCEFLWMYTITKNTITKGDNDYIVTIVVTNFCKNCSIAKKIFPVKFSDMVANIFQCKILPVHSVRFLETTCKYILKKLRLMVDQHRVMLFSSVWQWHTIPSAREEISAPGLDHIGSEQHHWQVNCYYCSCYCGNTSHPWHTVSGTEILQWSVYSQYIYTNYL